MRKIIILLVATLATLNGWALRVEGNTAGNLANKITDLTITSLEVTGEMDARDFQFIAFSLKNLSSLDLSAVNIVAYHGKEPLFSTTLDYPAASIPTAACTGKPLTTVKLPANLKVIGEAAFAGCESLTTVQLPATLTRIDAFAFSGSGLKSVKLPATVDSVGIGAFARCHKLTTVSVTSGGVLSHVGHAAFLDCPALTDVELGKNLITLGNDVMSGTGVSELDLSSATRLRQVGDWAFVGTPLESVDLPSNITRLGQGALMRQDQLSSISLPSRLTRVSDYLLAGSAVVNDPGLNNIIDTIGQYAFYNVSGITDMTLPSGLDYMGTRAMAGMTGLKTLKEDARKVPALGERVWDGVKQSAVTLTVFATLVNAYEATPQWTEFFIKAGNVIGDVNGDGLVTIADANAIISIILNGTGSTDAATLGRADVNGDGLVTIADANVVISIILNGTGHAMNLPEPNTNDQLTLDDLSIKPGEERTVDILLTADGKYSAMQCDIVMPSGLSIVDHSIVCGSRAAGHTIGSATVDNVTRIVMYSTDGYRFGDDTSDALLRLTVRADDGLASESDIIIDNVVLATQEAESGYAPATRARVSSTTDINSLSANADKVYAYGHSLVIETAKAATAQIVRLDGTTQPLDVQPGRTETQLETGVYVVVLNGVSHKVMIK